MKGASLIFTPEEIVYRNNAKGVFLIELAIVLVCISGILIMILNHLVAFNSKGQLDRAAYSLATILSERKQLFDDELNLCHDAQSCNVEVENAYNFVTASLGRMNKSFDKGKFGLRIDELNLTTSFNSSGQPFYTLVSSSPLLHGNINQCKFPGVADLTSIKAAELLPVTPTGSTRLPMYQVSLCYAIPLDILGAISGEHLQLISSSYSFERI